ncbi:head GIN domain-containing protein [Pseudoduganella sp. GCM10020061]|uniref:head GIN domain-containing protein n=1 Tax=Pseudoduganella sp. GCM10020061 TaxID=3317345 RepID=UPI003642DEF5
MTRLFQAAVIATALCASGAALAQQVSETRPVDGRVSRIELGGVIELIVKQGPTASLTLSGDKRLVSRVTTSQKGDVLVIDMDKSTFSWGRDNGSVKVHLTVPQLSELTSTGVGASTLTGFSGNRISLVQEGAGSINMNSNYKFVKVRLGGVGSMKIESGASEEVDLSLAGAGKISISGKAKVLRASLGGLGGLDAKELYADSVDVDMSGLGGATVYAKHSANVNLSGMGSATVYGKPAQRTTNDHGMGSVSWN